MTNIDRIREAYAAWAQSGAKDTDVWPRLMADDIRFTTVFGSLPGGRFKSSYRLEEIGEYFQALAESFEMKKMTPTAFVEDGDTVVGLFNSEWINRATGKRFVGDIVTIWTFEGDMAVEYREVFDTAAAAATMA